MLATASGPTVLDDLRLTFGDRTLTTQQTRDETSTIWVDKNLAHKVLGHLKRDVPKPYRTLYDLTAIDERVRNSRAGQPPSDFTVVYHLLSYERNEDIRLKVALNGDHPSLPTITDLWPAANWYEREIWDMFGITFDGHPHLERILMPRTWEGHPLRKEHPARATEMGPFRLPEDKREAEQEALKFRPEHWGLTRRRSEEHTSELQSRGLTSYAVFCLT